MWIHFEWKRCCFKWNVTLFEIKSSLGLVDWHENVKESIYGHDVDPISASTCTTDTKWNKNISYDGNISYSIIILYVYKYLCICEKMKRLIKKIFLKVIFL